MPSGYFHRVAEQTPTRFWINNPSSDDMERAISAGAVNVTTNPAYCSKLLKSDSDYVRSVIDGVVRERRDDGPSADLVYQRCASRIMERFLPLYRESGGSWGYVTIQADPREDNDANAVIEAARRYRRLGENFMAKIPVIPAGLEAMEVLIAEDMPICATEVFSIAQAICICELYQRTAEKSGKHPPFYVTHITGIFDQYLQRVMKRDDISISPDVLKHAGCAVARKEYRILKERGYEGTMLGGGARGMQHFTEFVGGDVHITINWSTAQELIDTDPDVVPRVDIETPADVLDELTAKLPDFAKAFDDDGLSVDEFEDFGPVQMFRDNFLEGYYLLLAQIAARRAENP